MSHLINEGRGIAKENADKSKESSDIAKENGNKEYETPNAVNGFLAFSKSVSDKAIRTTSRDKLVEGVNSLEQAYYSLFPAAQKVGLGEEEKAKCSGFLNKLVVSPDEGGRAHYAHMMSTDQINSFSKEYSERFNEVMRNEPYRGLINEALKHEFSKGQQCTIRKFCDAEAGGVDISLYWGGNDGFAYKFASKPEQYYKCSDEPVPSIYSQEFIEFSCHLPGVDGFSCTQDL